VRALPILAAAAAAAACGCVSVDEDARLAVESLAAGNDAPALKWSADLADDSFYSRNLGTVESGRVNMLAGCYAEAERRFREAVDSAVDRSESSPKLKIGDAADTAMASTVTDDRTREYQLPPYELNLALEYAILAQAINGKREDALVDSRLAVYVQDTLPETYGEDMTKEPDGSSEASRKIVDEQNAVLDEMIAATRNSWENPVLWWLTGVMFEADGQLDMAWQSYRKAKAISPDNAVFAADAARAEKSVTPPPGKAKLVVLYDQGFVPQRESLKVMVPIYTAFTVDIPKYPQSVFAYENVSVSGTGGAGAAVPSLDVRSLAARDLKEQLPGIIVRNITRAAVQAGAQAAVNAAGNEYAQIAVFAGNAIVSALRRADTRSWVTLPAAQHVWVDAAAEPGEKDIAISAGGRTIHAKVPLAPGETRILWVASAGATARGASAPVGGRAAAAATDLNGNALNGKEVK